MSDGYAGDLSPAEAWSLLEQDPSAVLVDVRTVARMVLCGFARPCKTSPRSRCGSPGKCFHPCRSTPNLSKSWANVSP